MIRFRDPTEAIMTAKEIIVKKYVVRLSGDEREQLTALAWKGHGPAQRLLRRGSCCRRTPPTGQPQSEWIELQKEAPNFTFSPI